LIARLFPNVGQSYSFCGGGLMRVDITSRQRSLSAMALHHVRGEPIMTELKITRRGMIGGVAAGIGCATVAATGDTIVSAARAQSAPKTFVLIHGAWVGGWYWRRVSDLLEKKGHKVFSPTLTGLGERSHLLGKDINLDTHVTDIVNVIKWEDLGDICYVAHSYGGFPASGALDQIVGQVSSIVWVDAFKPNDGEKLIDLVPDARRQAILSAFEKGEPGLRAPKAEVFLVNENDRALADAKTTPHPTATFVQAIKLSGERDKIAKKTYIRATRFQNPGFDKALADCKADKSWTVVETNIPGHVIMLDAPEWLADQLLGAA
jgi:pimeloyl-ACP methyl ester carboxylesterase